MFWVFFFLKKLFDNTYTCFININRTILNINVSVERVFNVNRFFCFFFVFYLIDTLYFIYTITGISKTYGIKLDGVILVIYLLFFFFIFFMYFIYLIFQNQQWLNRDEVIPIFIMFFSTIFAYYLIYASNFLTLYCALEGLSLSTLFLLSRNFFKKGSKETFFKYFCFSSFSAIILLGSICTLYIITFSLDFVTIKLLIIKNNFLLYTQPDIFFTLNHGFHTVSVVGVSLLITSFLFKLGIFPFHFLTPDLYALTSIPFLTYYAFLLKPIYIIILLNLIFYVFSDLSNILLGLFLFVGSGSILVGCFGALGQVNVFKLLGYSSVTQIGLIFLSLGSFSVNILIVVFFLLCYLLTFMLFMISLLLLRIQFGKLLLFKGSLFLIGTSLLHTLQTLKSARLCKMLGILGLFGVFVAFISNAALPPFLGFFSKYILIISLIFKENIFFLLWLLFINIIIAYYYIQTVCILTSFLFYKDYNERLLKRNHKKSPTDVYEKINNFFIICCFLMQVSYLLIYICLPLYISNIFIQLVCIFNYLFYSLSFFNFI